MDHEWGKHKSYFDSKDAFLFSVTSKKKFNKVSTNAGFFDEKSYGLSFGDSLYAYLNENGAYGYC